MNFWEEEEGYLSLDDKEDIFAGAVERYLEWCRQHDTEPMKCEVYRNDISMACGREMPCHEHVLDYRGRD